VKRDQLEHILRAASRIADDPDVFVIGSQAILASYDDAYGRVEALMDCWVGLVEISLGVT
jgi:hypothetical protein